MPDDMLDLRRIEHDVTKVGKSEAEHEHRKRGERVSVVALKEHLSDVMEEQLLPYDGGEHACKGQQNKIDGRGKIRVSEVDQRAEAERQQKP